jgi:hypothetical protein
MNRPWWSLSLGAAVRRLGCSRNVDFACEPESENAMKYRISAIIVAWITVLEVSAMAHDAQEKHAGAYVAPYGLTKADLGTAAALNFLHAVLGEGNRSEQDAAITVLASDDKTTGGELQSIADHFERRDTGVQAVVWRDTGSGKCKRASESTRFDPRCDRIEVLFAKFDLKALQALPKARLKEPTAASKEWVSSIVEAQKKAPKVYRAAQGLAGALGGSGDFKLGNIFPISQKAQAQFSEMESALVVNVQKVRTTPTICALVVFRYPDPKSRIPSKIYYYYAIEKSLWAADVIDNE